MRKSGMARASLVKFLPTIYCAFLKFKHFDNSLIISDNRPHCVRRTANSSLMDLHYPVAITQSWGGFGWGTWRYQHLQDELLVISLSRQKSPSYNTEKSRPFYSKIELIINGLQDNKSRQLSLQIYLSPIINCWHSNFNSLETRNIIF